MDDQNPQDPNVFVVGGDESGLFSEPPAQPLPDVAIVGGDPAGLAPTPSDVEPATITIGGDPGGLYPEPAPGTLPDVAIVGGDPGLFPPPGDGSPGTVTIGGDPTGMFGHADGWPDAPTTATVGNPWGPDPVPSDGQPAGPGVAIVGPSGPPLPPTPDPLVLTNAIVTIQERQAQETWQQLLPGTPYPAGASPVEVYLELMAHTQDPQVIEMLRARIESIQNGISIQLQP